MCNLEASGTRDGANQVPQSASIQCKEDHVFAHRISLQADPRGILLQTVHPLSSLGAQPGPDSAESPTPSTSERPSVIMMTLLNSVQRTIGHDA